MVAAVLVLTVSLGQAAVVSDFNNRVALAGGQAMVAVGVVTGNDGVSQVTVATGPKGAASVTVQVGGSTIIMKKGVQISLGDLTLDDHVTCTGSKVDDSTLLANRIEVH